MRIFGQLSGESAGGGMEIESSTTFDVFCNFHEILLFGERWEGRVAARHNVTSRRIGPRVQEALWTTEYQEIRISLLHVWLLN
jgi:hypothetical protein